MKLYRKAFANGYLKIVKYLFIGLNQEQTRQQLSNILGNCIVHKYRNSIGNNACNCSCITFAILFGHLNIITFIVENILPIANYTLKDICSHDGCDHIISNTLSSAKQIHIFKYIISKDDSLLSDNLIHRVAELNDLSLLKLVLKKFSDE
jgi:hypothetical protein